MAYRSSAMVGQYIIKNIHYGNQVAKMHTVNIYLIYKQDISQWIPIRGGKKKLIRSCTTKEKKKKKKDLHSLL